MGYVEDRKIRVCETNVDYAEPLTVAYEGAVGVYQVPNVMPTWLVYVQFNGRYNTNRYTPRTYIAAVCGLLCRVSVMDVEGSVVRKARWYTRVRVC